MTATPFFHVGVLVHDLDLAMDRFARVFKVTWTDRVTAHADFWQQGQDVEPLALDVVYSREGPPHLELLQATGDGLYAPARGEGLHHIGAWEPDCTTRQRELEAAGFRSVGTQFTPQKEIIVSYFDPEVLHGIMFEILDESRRPMMESWFAGGPFSD
jgi:hypothetical protein